MDKTIDTNLMCFSGKAIITDIKMLYDASRKCEFIKIMLLDNNIRPQPFAFYGSDRVAKRWKENFNVNDIVEYSLYQERQAIWCYDCLWPNFVMDRATLKLAK